MRKQDSNVEKNVCGFLNEWSEFITTNHDTMEIRIKFGNWWGVTFEYQCEWSDRTQPFLAPFMISLDINRIVSVTFVN